MRRFSKIKCDICIKLLWFVWITDRNPKIQIEKYIYSCEKIRVLNTFFFFLNNIYYDFNQILKLIIRSFIMLYVSFRITSCHANLPEHYIINNDCIIALLSWILTRTADMNYFTIIVDQLAVVTFKRIMSSSSLSISVRSNRLI